MTAASVVVTFVVLVATDTAAYAAVVMAVTSACDTLNFLLPRVLFLLQLYPWL